MAIQYSGHDFPSSNWTFGGEGHLVLGTHYMIGGKAFGIMHERAVTNSIDLSTSRLRVTGGLGLLTLGISLFGPNDFGLRLYPQVGLGASTFLFQKKDTLPLNSTFDSLYIPGRSDNMVSVGKAGWAVDVGAGIDWYKPFKNFFAIIKGLDLGIMLHGEVGYTFVLGNLNWLRDVSMSSNDNLALAPDLKFGGFYWNVGIGIGLSPQDDEDKKK